MPKEVRYVACPRCDAPARHAHLRSGNLIGARFWSDGKLQTAMWEREVEVARCPACRAFFWIRDARELSERPRRRTRVPWLSEPAPDELLEAATGDAARSRGQEVRLRQLAWWGMNDPLREPWELQLGCCAAVLALVAWPLVVYFPGDGWVDRLVLAFLALNAAVIVVAALVQLGDLWRDARRRRRLAADPQGPFRVNLVALVDRLDPARPEERVLRAEALRELGRFSEALELLEDPLPGHLRGWGEAVRRLARAGDSLARPVQPVVRVGA